MDLSEDPGFSLGELGVVSPRKSRVEVEAYALYQTIRKEGKGVIGDEQYGIIKIDKEDIDFEDPFKIATFESTGVTYVILSPSRGSQRGQRDHQKIVLDIYSTTSATSEVISVSSLSEVVLFFHVVALEFLRMYQVEDVGLFRHGGSFLPVRRSTMSSFGTDLERFLTRAPV